MVVGEKKLVDVLTDSPRGLPLEQAVPSLLRCLGFMEDEVLALSGPTLGHYWLGCLHFLKDFKYMLVCCICIIIHIQ